MVAAARQRAQEPTAQYDYSLLIETAFGSGLRIGELLGLQWRDVDFERRLLRVERQWTDGALADHPKSDAGRRDLPISDELLRKLRAHKLASTYSLDTDSVFCSTTGQHLQPGNVRQRGWGKALEKAGIPHIRFHETRHAYASTLTRCAGARHERRVGDGPLGRDGDLENLQPSLRPREQPRCCSRGDGGPRMKAK